MRLVELEPGHRTMPTAVFYFVEGSEAHGPPRAFGRAALAAYVDGVDGRLMRSMKSILGSSLVEQTTDVGGGRGVKYLDIIAGYLLHLKTLAERAGRCPIDRVVLGRPVFFVDDDPSATRRPRPRWNPRRVPSASASAASSTSRSPPPSTTSAA
jgi:hypothetical chaperone protein